MIKMELNLSSHPSIELEEGEVAPDREAVVAEDAATHPSPDTQQVVHEGGVHVGEGGAD